MHIKNKKPHIAQLFAGPWYVEAVNLTPNFGANWGKHSLYKDNLINEFLEANPNGIITTARGQTLNALRFGADKLNIAPDFAMFVIDKMMALDSA